MCTHRGVAGDEQVLDVEQVAVQVLQVDDIRVHEETARLAQCPGGERVFCVHDPPTAHKARERECICEVQES